MHHRRWTRAVLLAFALFGAACGGGSDDPDTAATAGSGDANDGANDGTDAAAPPGGPVVADDGLLTLDPPDGAASVTVEPGDATTLDGFELIASYELGPDGATFDEPVVATMQLTDEQAAAGVLAILTSADGTIEALPAIDISDDGVIRHEIPHFSGWDYFAGQGSEPFALGAPATAIVEQSFTAALTHDWVEFATVREWEQLNRTPDILRVELDPASSDGLMAWTVTCLAAGPGRLHWGDSTVDYEVTIDGSELPVTRKFVILEADIMCQAPTPPVPPVDYRCFTLSDGSDLPTETCLMPDSLMVSSLDPLTISVDTTSLGDAVSDVTVGVTAIAADGTPIYIEGSTTEGFYVWYGPGFNGVESEWLPLDGIPLEAITDVTFDVVTVVDGAVVVRVPEGLLAFGGDPVTAGDYAVSSVDLFMDVDDARHIVHYGSDPDAIFFPDE